MTDKPTNEEALKSLDRLSEIAWLYLDLRDEEYDNTDENIIKQALQAQPKEVDLDKLKRLTDRSNERWAMNEVWNNCLDYIKQKWKVIER